MTARVINDPSALGWDYDPTTGRWTWGGSGGGSNGGGSGSFPEAPVNGKQYGRQDAGWTEIVGGGGSVDLTNYYTKPESDNKFQVKGNYLTDFIEEDPTVPAHVKSISVADINKWNNPPTGGGGTGGAVSSVNGKTGAVTLNYADVGAQVAGSYAASNHNHNGVYQPAGNYALVGASYTKSESDNKWQPKGSYATTSYAYSKAESDGKYELKGAGGATPTLDQVLGAGAQSGKSATAQNWYTNLDAWTVGNATGVSMKQVSEVFYFKDASAANIITLNMKTGVARAVDFESTSDERLKSHITGAPVGVIEQLNGKEWEWQRTGAKGSGVIAQELEKVLPHLVNEDSEGMKTVSYSGLTAYLIEELKSLRAEVEELKRER